MVVDKGVWLTLPHILHEHTELHIVDFAAYKVRASAVHGSKMLVQPLYYIRTVELHKPLPDELVRLKLGLDHLVPIPLQNLVVERSCSRLGDTEQVAYLGVREDALVRVVRSGNLWQR